ncbi:hypothetical protein BaRGS_00022463 [Batillaria attramentaria]|uniref:Uncharacterized protein n=1 Tax=Batillaria attramentaria TaxID=370345 RepID=A0ABD0KGB8_9CAEN
MIEEGQLYKVRQLAVEFHRKREDEDLRDLMVSSLAVLRGLQEMGFLKYLSLMKGECARKALGYDDVTRTSCYKVCFVNVNLKQG